ncbi:MAG: T9SS type A sorting domain-containing protein [Bacteroidota bacterium]
MKKIKTVFFLSIVGLNFISAQVPFRKIFFAAAGFSTIPYSITETSDSDFLMISNYGQTQNARYNILLNKINHNGNPVWAREIKLSSDYLNPMLVVDMKEQGELIVTHGDVRSVWVDSTLFIRLDTSGNLTSIQAIGMFEPDIWAFNISDSSILMKMDYGGDVQLVNYDVHGNIKWSKILNEPPSPYFYYSTIEPIDHGSFVLIGWTENDIGMIKLDSSGVVTLSKTFLPSDSLTYLSPISFISAGFNSYLFSYYMIKNQQNEIGFLLLDSMGNQLVNKVYLLTGLFGYGNVCARNSEFIFYNMLQINASRYAPCALTLDSALNFISLATISDTTFNDGFGQVMCTQKNELLFTTGDNDPSALYNIQMTDSLTNFACINYPFTYAEDSVILNDYTYNFSTSPLNVAFGPNVTNIFINPVSITSIDYCGTFLNIPEINEMAFSVYPNPVADNKIFITFFASQSENLRLTFQDITGRFIYESQLPTLPGTNKKEILVGDLAKGIYIVTLNGTEGSKSIKVLK